MKTQHSTRHYSRAIYEQSIYMVPVSVAAAASYQVAKWPACASHAAGFPESTAGEMERRLLATAINAARRGHLIMLFFQYK